MADRKREKADRISSAIANADSLLKNEDIETNKLYGWQTRKRFQNPALVMARALGGRIKLTYEKNN
jgi:hypothetical protein